MTPALTLPLALALGLEIERDRATIMCHHDGASGVCQGRLALMGTELGPLPASGCTAGHDFDEVVAALDERLAWLEARAEPDPFEDFVDTLALAARRHGIDRVKFLAAVEEASLGRT
jgi:hypothetical protein